MIFLQIRMTFFSKTLLWNPVMKQPTGKYLRISGNKAIFTDTWRMRGVSCINFTYFCSYYDIFAFVVRILLLFRYDNGYNFDIIRNNVTSSCVCCLTMINKWSFWGQPVLVQPWIWFHWMPYTILVRLSRNFENRRGTHLQ